MTDGTETVPVRADLVVQEGEADGNVCSVWWVDLQDDPGLLSLLSPAERGRAASIGKWQARQRFVTARALLRAVLAERLRAPADSFVIRTTCRICGSTDHGRPELPDLGLTVSISHSDGTVGLAISGARIDGGHCGVPIGLDIERLTKWSHSDTALVANVALTSGERDSWKSMPQEDQVAAALNWWTRKEAVLKATGWGLVISPAMLQLTSPLDRPAVTWWAPEAVHLLGGVLPHVYLYDIRPGRQFVGALASLGAPVQIYQRAGGRLLAEVAA